MSVVNLANGGSNSSIGQSSANAANLVMDGGTLQYTGAGATTNRSFTLGVGNGTLDSSGTGALNWSNTSAMAFTTANVAHTLTLTGNYAGTNLFAGKLKDDGSGATSLVLAGSGTWTLSGANNYSGGTTLSSGGLNVNSNTALGTGALVITGGTLDNTSGGNVTLTNNNAQNWNGDFAFNGTNNLNMGTGNVSLGSARTVTVNAGTLTVGGVIDSGGHTYNFTKDGAGTLVLSAANTYTGVTTLDNGVLSVSVLDIGGNASGIGASTSAATKLVFNGGTLQYTGTGATTDRKFTLGVNGGTIDASGTGNLTFSATTAVATSGTGTRTLTLTGSNTGANTFSGVLADQSSNPTSLVKAGAGQWVLAGKNTFTGTTTVQGGTLALGDASAPALNGTSAVTVSSGGTLLLDASNQINDTATMTLAGGTFAANGFSEGAGGAPGLGGLTLSANSTLDLGAAGGSVIAFGDSSGATWGNSTVLDIANYDQGSGDQVFFGTTSGGLTSGQLGQIVFVNPVGFQPGTYGALILSTGQIHVAAAPEPATWGAGALLAALLGAGEYRRRRRK